jgi:hypothetical protein
MAWFLDSLLPKVYVPRQFGEQKEELTQASRLRGFYSPTSRKTVVC